MKQRLIIIQGVPGTGKTTLAKRLSEDLGLPWLGKDTVKEFLFDSVGVEDAGGRFPLGPISLETLYTFGRIMAGKGHPVIVEANFYGDWARPAFEAIIREGVSILEIYCRSDPKVLLDRFVTRKNSGKRNPGHPDTVLPSIEENARLPEVYPPLKVGEYAELDTTVFSEASYEEIKGRAARFINN